MVPTGPLGGEKLKNCGVTRNVTLLLREPPGVTTVRLPVVAPAGTAGVIWLPDITLNVAFVPLKLTLVVSVRLLPRMFSVDFTLPELGRASTNGSKLLERLNTVP